MFRVLGFLGFSVLGFRGGICPGTAPCSGTGKGSHHCRAIEKPSLRVFSGE